jgi:hypothetical protein
MIEFAAVSDIHGNLPALEAVIDTSPRRVSPGSSIWVTAFGAAMAA